MDLSHIPNIENWSEPDKVFFSEGNNLPKFQNPPPPPPPLTKDGCKVCGDECHSFFNIKMKLVRVCPSCAGAIFIQQANWFILNKKHESL